MVGCPCTIEPSDICRPQSSQQRIQCNMFYCHRYAQCLGSIKMAPMFIVLVVATFVAHCSATSIEVGGSSVKDLDFRVREAVLKNFVKVVEDTQNRLDRERKTCNTKIETLLATCKECPQDTQEEGEDHEEEEEEEKMSKFDKMTIKVVSILKKTEKITKLLSGYNAIKSAVKLLKKPVKKLGRAIGRVVRRVARSVKGAARRVGRAVSRSVKRLARGLRRLVRRAGRVVRRIGRSVRKVLRKVRIRIRWRRRRRRRRRWGKKRNISLSAACGLCASLAEKEEDAIVAAICGGTYAQDERRMLIWLKRFIPIFEKLSNAIDSLEFVKKVDYERQSLVWDAEGMAFTNSHVTIAANGKSKRFKSPNWMRFPMKSEVMAPAIAREVLYLYGLENC